MTEPKETAFMLRKHDMSYPMIRDYLEDILGIKVSCNTVRNWIEDICKRELGK